MTSALAIPPGTRAGGGATFTGEHGSAAPNWRERIEALRAVAQSDGLPVRRADARLYAILADCLAICEDALSQNALPELRRAVMVSVSGVAPAGRGRKYLEQRADAYVIVARAVLDGIDNRNSVYRYAMTMREAARRGIASQALEKWLGENGGINALFKARPVSARKATTRTLNLNQSVTVPKDGTFTLTLRRDARGFFDVVEART